MIIARISHFKPKYHILFTVWGRNMRLQIRGRGEINFISLVNTRSSWVRRKQGPYLARSSACRTDRRGVETAAGICSRESAPRCAPACMALPSLRAANGMATATLLEHEGTAQGCSCASGSSAVVSSPSRNEDFNA